MTKTIRSAVAGMSLTLFSLGAQAEAYDFGILSRGDARSSLEAEFGDAGLVVGDFADTWAFQLADDGSTVSSAVSLSIMDWFHISNGEYRLYSGVVDGVTELLGTWSFDGESGATQNVVSLMSAGPYYLAVSGSADGKLGGQYMVSIAAPVPEPETYALLLAGLALVGFAARRRKGLSLTQAVA